jgi:hypothetical protein
VGSKLKQSGRCNTCNIEVEDVYYIFCSIKCRDTWILLEENQMGQYDLDKEIFINWLNEKNKAIELMSKEEIEARINECINIEFYAKAEGSALSRRLDKMTGKKGIPEWLLKERNELITDPQIRVNWDGEPRKKEKKPKQNLVGDLLGIDMSELVSDINKKKKEALAESKSTEDKPKKQTQADVINSLINVKPKVEPVKPTPEEIKAKADAIKEKIRLAKEARAKANGDIKTENEPE